MLLKIPITQPYALPFDFRDMLTVCKEFFQKLPLFSPSCSAEWSFKAEWTAVKHGSNVTFRFRIGN